LHRKTWVYIYIYISTYGRIYVLCACSQIVNLSPSQAFWNECNSKPSFCVLPWPFR
jgi:hypothetical protein